MRETTFVCRLPPYFLTYRSYLFSELSLFTLDTFCVYRLYSSGAKRGLLCFSFILVDDRMVIIIEIDRLPVHLP